ncbi:unnamed protein product [Cladocopium goreaui]|uniref:J domain-containing protein n=1 Tax=Cladocopium goreaui TaxID=2562237 RepID=A0A9P1GB04_9DINO|nr:unnamed protein product [Cladocopium goreaui]
MLRLSRLLRVQKCPYAVLGVSETATTAEIKRAFQDRAKITHPDVAKGKDSHFREMVEAYRILRDPKKRGEHDRQASRARFGADTTDTWPRGEGEGLSEAARAKLYNYPMGGRSSRDRRPPPGFEGPQVVPTAWAGDRIPLYILAFFGTFYAYKYYLANDPTKMKDMDPYPTRLPAKELAREAKAKAAALIPAPDAELGTSRAAAYDKAAAVADDTDKRVWAYYNPFLTVWHRIPDGFEPPASMDLTAWHKKRTDPSEWSRLFAEGKLAEIIPRGGLKVRLIPAWDTHEPVLLKDPLTQKTVQVTQKLLKARATSTKPQSCEIRF